MNTFKYAIPDTINPVTLQLRHTNPLVETYAYVSDLFVSQGKTAPFVRDGMLEFDAHSVVDANRLVAPLGIAPLPEPVVLEPSESKQTE